MTAAPAPGSPDPGALIADIEAEVARKRAAGEYPAALLERLRAEFRPGAEEEPPETSALIESARPLRSAVPGVAPVVVFAKRVVRRLLAWYVAPIAVDQTRFNLAILGDLRALEDRVAALEQRDTEAAGRVGGDHPPAPPGS